MKRYVIERDLPGVGKMNLEQLKSAAATSNEALSKLPGKVQLVFPTPARIASAPLTTLSLALEELSWAIRCSSGPLPASRHELGNGSIHLYGLRNTVFDQRYSAFAL
jgi:hypothetical protein